MKRHTYVGAIGIIAFFFACLQLAGILWLPMIGYLVFKGGGGQYSPSDYLDRIPSAAYVFTVVLFAIAIGALVFVSNDGGEKSS